MSKKIKSPFLMLLTGFSLGIFVLLGLSATQKNNQDNNQEKRKSKGDTKII